MEKLVENLIALGALKSKEIIDSFLAIDRKNFVPNELTDVAYLDEALPIGYDQTISQPFTVAVMFEMLKPKIGQKILDVGSGSGWTTALLSKIVGPQGSVIGVELIPQLATFGQNNLTKLQTQNAKIIKAGKKLGYPENAPYDRILVSAETNQIPEALTNQLVPGGIMVIPINNNLVKVYKNKDGTLKTTTKEGFVFVPLIIS